MKLIFSFVFSVCFLFSSAQKINVQTLETILFANFHQADSVLKKTKFSLADKETGNGYLNYYYTSYEKLDSSLTMIRSVTLVDIYKGTDTSRMVLYRTYSKEDEEELAQLLLDNGYILMKQSGTSSYYTKGTITILNRISEKTVPGKASLIAYEFEAGR